MAKPTSVLSSDTFATWRTRFNTFLGQAPEVVESANAPTVDDDITDYEMGTLWIRTTDDTAYILADNTNGAAVWTQLGATPGALKDDGTVPLAANWDVGGFNITSIGNAQVDTAIYSDLATGSLRISGSTAANVGANIELYGETHASQANDIAFRSADVLEALFDASANLWDFQGNAISTTGAVSCGAFTSTGIYDNASAERLQIIDTEILFGPSGSASGGVLRRYVNDGLATLSGGNSVSAGANIWLYGGTHATLANDIDFRASATTILYYDHSAGSWDFQAKDIVDAGDINGATITASAGFSGPGGSITGVNASQLNGYASATTATADTIARRDASGDLAVNGLTSAGATGITAGTTSSTWIGEYGIYLEDEKHTISVNDGFGNFNIRVANNPLGGAYPATENCTEAGYASHIEFTQSTGIWNFQVSSISLSLGGTPSWRSQMTIDPTDVTLAYQGSTKLTTVSNGVSITGNITADNIGSIAAKDFWSGTQASYDGIGTPDANTIYFITE